MEDGLVHYDDNWNIVNEPVLILVVMEDGLVPEAIILLRNEIKVLILVVMEDGLVPPTTIKTFIL